MGKQRAASTGQDPPGPRRPAANAVPALPSDPLAAMESVARSHAESQAAFVQLLTAPQENVARRELHRVYRETTARHLELLRRHNESGLAPSQWDLTTVAQPLVQQTLIEADIVDALGLPAEATGLREWAVQLANRELPPLVVARVRRSMASQSAAEGRFNEALAEFDDLRRLFADAGEVIEAAQTALEAAVLLEWLGDEERTLEAVTAARALVAAQAGTELPIVDRTAEAFERERQSIMAGSGPTGEADRAAALWRVSVEIVEHEARVRKATGEYDAAAALFERVLRNYESIGGGAAIEYQLAAIDRARGRYVEARTRIERIAPAFADGILSGKVAGLRLLQAFVALGLDEPAHSLRLADEGLAQLETHPDEDLAWRLHWRRAEALRALGRTGKAIAAYAEAAAVVDSLRKAPLGYRLDSTSLRAKLPLIEDAIKLAADSGDAAACLRFIEMVKSRALSSA